MGRKYTYRGDRGKGIDGGKKQGRERERRRRGGKSGEAGENAARKWGKSVSIVSKQEIKCHCRRNGVKASENVSRLRQRFTMDERMS